jgi:uncharacterized membrane protein YfcA
MVRLGLNLTNDYRHRPRLTGFHLIYVMAGLTAGALLARNVQGGALGWALFAAAAASSVARIALGVRSNRRVGTAAFVLWFVLAGYLVVLQQLIRES